MLYPYKYPKAKIQQLQSFVNYIMLEVVLRAKKIPDPTFSVGLVIPKYEGIIRDVNAKYILDPISNMYLDSKKLDRFHLKLLRKAVLENNRIEELCDGRFSPVRYKYLSTFFTQNFEKDMLENINTFCAKLYEKCLYSPISYDYYMDCLVYVITHISPKLIIHRISGDAPKDLLVAPTWNLHKKKVLNGLDKILKEKDLYQGKFF